MPEKLPASITAQRVSGKGIGLFTSKPVDAGALVLSIERPLVRVPDNEHLAQTCYNCFYLLPPEDRSDTVTKTLKTCTGCQVVKYCSQRCQAQSWKAEHKYECKALGRVYPKVPPSAVRVVMQLLLRRQAGSLSEAEWQDLLKLEAHFEAFLTDEEPIGPGKGTKAEDIRLMSQAASAFSGVSEPLYVIQALIARVMINSMTVVTGAFDTLGSCVSTTAARLNHSCNPNCTYMFSEGSLVVRSLQAIPKGSELTISYVNLRAPTVERQQELQSKWLFTCTCEYCTRGLTCGLPDLPPSLQSGMSAEKLTHLDNEGRKLQKHASVAPADAEVAILISAMRLFTPHKDIYPSWRSPWSSIRHDLKVAQIGQGNWASALGHALRFYLHIDPTLFPMPWNPHRAAETYGLLKIIMEILYQLTKPERNEQLLKELWDYKIDFPSVIRHLSDEVEDTFKKGFGPRSPVADDIVGYDQQGIDFGSSEWEAELAKLKRAAVGLVD